ncbi:DeoR/GlpR family DNA-binding transcription regulator [Paenarthrobacter sp. RAF54_2]
MSRKRLERMRQILSVLHTEQSVSLEALVVRLGSSKATLRRDLAELDEQGLLVRTHGGARANESSAEIPARLRDSQARDAKILIARTAAQMIPTGPHALAVNGGTTTHDVLRALHYRTGLTVITNALTIATDCAANPRFNVIMTGGKVRSSSLEAVGPLAEATFRSMNIGTAVLGTDGISAEGGVTTHDDTEARTNNAMVNAAKRVIVVADGSKVGEVTLAKMADLTQIDDLVTDPSADPTALDQIAQAGVRIHVVSYKNTIGS